VVVEFPGPIVPSTGRKGWDGCIYGPDRPIKKPTSRVTIIPPAPPGLPPITELYLYASGVAALPIEQPSLTAKEKPYRDGHITLMKAYEDGLEFGVVGNGGGVEVELGYANAFDLRLTKFATNALPGEELLTRTIGPIRLTNRPAPPFLDALLLKASDTGVDCSADFSNLDSPTVRVQVWLGGSLVTQRTGVPATLGQTLFSLSGWPDRIGKLGGSTPCRTIKRPASAIRLPGGGGLPPVEVVGDECRVLAETPPGTPHPDAYTGLEFIATEGADWGVSQLLTSPACTPVPLRVTHASDGSIMVTWEGAGFRAQGAVDATGPWLDLGVGSPITLPASYPGRYFRLVCD